MKPWNLKITPRSTLFLIKLLIVSLHNSPKIINTKRGRQSFSTSDPRTKRLVELEGDCSWSVSAGSPAAEGRRVVENFLANNSCRVTCSNSRVSPRRYKIASCLGRGQVRPGAGLHFSLHRHRGRVGIEWRSILSQESHRAPWPMSRGNFHAPFPPNRFYRFRVVVAIIIITIIALVSA